MLISVFHYVRIFSAFAWLVSVGSSATYNVNYNLAQLQLIRYNGNRSTSPCVDFYEHSCGNWGQQQPINFIYLTALDKLDNELNQKFVDMLEMGLSKQSQKNATSKIEYLLYNFYAACRAVENYRAAPYLNWLLAEEPNIRWPTVLPGNDTGNITYYDWLQFLGQLRRYGFNGVLIEESALQQGKNARVWLLDVDQPTHNSFIPLQKSQFQRIMELFEVNAIDKVKVTQLWRQIRRLEQQLKNLIDMECENKLDDDVTQVQPVANLKRIPWLARYLGVVMEASGPLDASTEVSVTHISYLTAMHTLLEQQYKPEFVCRYLMLRFVHYLDTNSPLFFDRTECSSSARNLLPFAMTWFYAEDSESKRIADEALPQLKRMFGALKRTFRRTLNANVNGFDGRVLRYLQNKLAHMQLKVDNLPHPQTQLRLEQFYTGLQIVSDNFHANQLRCLRHTMRAAHTYIAFPLSISAEAFMYFDEWNDFSTTSTPYFQPGWNLITLPLSLLNPPFYQPQMYNVFKYSIIGFLLAHEILHGFDESGIEYDWRGNWNTQMANRIRSNVRFKKHVSLLHSVHYEVDEKIADISGLQLAYETYFGESGLQQNLSLLYNNQLDIDSNKIDGNASENELFFQNFAQFFCFTKEDNVIWKEHGSNRDRLLDAITHLDKFTNVYMCYTESTSTMLRHQQLWT